MPHIHHTDWGSHSWNYVECVGEDGDNRIFRNVGKYTSNYTASYPRNSICLHFLSSWNFVVKTLNYQFILYFQLDTLLFCLRTISAIFFPLHVSGLKGPSSGGLNCTCSLWYSAPLQMSLSCGRWERKSSFSTATRQRHLQMGRIP